ncbi:MAG: putative lipid II flippase FtsW [Candidatus Kerfeldbacteria bacterium]|nr:putative lipid II flippase FtsW [Candidatus Kerfeldbacteria bacterium]
MPSVREHQPDYILGLTIIALLLFGLVMLASAGSVLGYQRFGDSNFFAKRQMVSILVGLVFFFIAYRLDYHRWQQWSVPILVVTVALLLAVFLPGLGSYFLGARRWINFGWFLVQPSELAKLTMVIYLAAWFERRPHQLNEVQATLVPFLTTVGLVAGLILAEPDLGTTTIVLVTSMVLYFVAGGPWRYLFAFGTAGLALFLMIIKLAPYRAQRFTVFLNPNLDPLGIGYHINQALLAIGSGGLFGLGLGHSRQKFNYLPEPAGDSIFAVVAEELGWIFVTIFVLAWMIFLHRGLSIARQAPDRFGQLVATGITSWLGFQAFLNIGALSGVVPLTGVPLPFLSHGGSAIITGLTAIGILMNISRQTVQGGRL